MCERAQPERDRDTRAAWESRIGPLLEERALIWLTGESGRRFFPAFQFNDHGPMRPLVEAFWTLAATANPWSAAGWCMSPTPHLDGATPVEWARGGGDPAALRTAAERDANRVQQ